MKLHHASIHLNVFGKPECCFEIEPETDLERDALKVMQYHQEANRFDKKNDIMVAQIDADENSNKMRVWTGWKISHERFMDNYK